ncbi:MAG: AsmA-like C-terminal region-containing protein [Opitutaceae bacterium]|nr:AsmA-like C-terminal region-containing protein [Opitutaceae bacterium]
MPGSNQAPVRKAASHILGGCLKAVAHWALWLVWLVLAVVLIFQIRIAVTHEISVPEKGIRKIEQRLREQGWEVSFDGVKLDAKGRAAFTGLSIRRTEGGPVLYCERADVRVNPWLVAAGHIEPTEVRISNARLILPPLLSPTGTEFPLATNIEVELEYTDDRWICRGLHGFLGPVDFDLSGPLPLRKSPSAKAATPDIARISQILRAAAAWLSRSDLVADPRLTVRLEPNGPTGPVAQLQLQASSLSVPLSELGLGSPAPLTATAKSLQLTADLDSFDEVPALVRLEFADVAAGDHRVGRLEARVKLEPKFKSMVGVVHSVQAAAWNVEVQRLALPHVRLSASPEGDAWRVALTTSLWGEGISAAVSGTPRTRSAEIALRMHVSQSLLDGLSAYLNKPYGTLLRPERPAPVEISASFGAGGHLAWASGWLRSGPVAVRGVNLTAAGGEFSLKGRELRFDRILLAAGDSLVHGSYAMDTQDRTYRFLLSGGLQPPVISGWFQSWWTRFWKNFSFTVTPTADTDIQGRWGSPSQTRLFISVDAIRPRVKSADFDRVRTRLFIRPHFYDALSLDVVASGQEARVTFTRKVDLEKNALSEQRVAGSSNLPFETYRGLFGGEAEEILEPFTSEAPPALTISGTIRGPASPSGPGRDLELSIHAPNRFSIYRFPLSDLKCEATLHDSDLHVRNLGVSFAGGRVAGEFTLAGKPAGRTLTLEATLKDARLGEAIQILDEFGIQKKGESTKNERAGRFQRENTDGLVSGFLKATGMQGDPYSFTGFGQAAVTNAKLAEINLLGQLSQALRSVPLLNFTSFSLTAATGEFELARERLHIPRLKITGPSAEIQARGDYLLKAKEMRIDATVYPFAESKNPFATTMGFVLSPLSAVLELRLEGTLEKPDWHFIRGPTELFRRLLPSGDAKSTESDDNKSQPTAPLRRQ